MSLWAILFSAGFVEAASRRSIALICAATGEIISEKAGILNIELEAMMLAGAFGGVLGADVTGSAWGGVVIGVLAGILVASLHGIVVIRLDGDQIVAGIALNIAALGATTYLARLIFGIGQTPSVASLDAVAVPGLADIPVLGPLIFQQDPIAYASIGLVGGAWYLLNRTRWGLEVRSCGESPSAADALGVAVNRLRWQALLLCGAMAGLGGVHLSLGIVSTFFEGMSAGRGFIALAIVIAAKWSVFRVVPIALLFGASEAVGVRIQAAGLDLPFQLMRALPYLVTLLVYAGVVGRAKEPAALGKRWLRA